MRLAEVGVFAAKKKEHYLLHNCSVFNFRDLFLCGKSKQFNNISSIVSINMISYFTKIC